MASNMSGADAYYARGIVYGELGQYQIAIADFTEAIHLDPDYANAYYIRGIAYGDLGQYQNALNDHTKACSLDSQFC